MAKKKSDGTETTDISTDDRPDARARLRAFEDEKVGADAVRINDEIERGSGSRYAALPEDDKRRHTAFLRCVAIEQRIMDARSTLATLEAEYDAAVVETEPRVEEKPEDQARADKERSDREAERQRDFETEQSRLKGEEDARRAGISQNDPLKPGEPQPDNKSQPSAMPPVSPLPTGSSSPSPASSVLDQSKSDGPATR